MSKVIRSASEVDESIDNPNFVEEILSLGKQGLAGDQAMYDELEKVRARASLKIINDVEERTDLSDEEKERRLRNLKGLYWKCLNCKHKSKSPLRNANIAYEAMSESFQHMRESLNELVELSHDVKESLNGK